MRVFLFLCLFSLIYCSTCPNLCSGHGTCSKSGTCVCYEGYTYGDCSGRVCAYGQTYVDPNAKTTANDDIHRYLECSGKGNCNRVNGVCECFEGFEGNACERLSCPNNCNSHGLCVPITHLKLDQNTYINVYKSKTYPNFDADQSFACVCDGEYSGYDCSEKKCPVGYSATSDCESSSEESTITVALPSENTKFNNIGKYVYLEYTDMYGRKWYSDKFDPLYTNDNSKYGWLFALKKLPVGVIDLKSVESSTATTPLVANDKVTIRFGNQQTGRQSNIKIITYKDITDDSNGNLYPGANTPSGYHGMSKDDLEKDYDTAAGDITYPTTNQAVGSDFTITYSGVSPTVCSGNGSCETDTGLCKCFEGFYGNACSLTESSM